MRIGLDLLPLLPDSSGGIEWYARNLVRSLTEIDQVNEYYLFTNIANHDSFGPDALNVRRILCSVRPANRVRRMLFEQMCLPGLASRYRIDVLHSPFYTLPLRGAATSVVTICDMLYRVHPQWVGQPKLTFWRLFIPQAARRCSRIVTISQNSKRDIVRFLRVPPSKVVVTPLAADGEFGWGGAPSQAELHKVRRRYNLEGEYVLCVGGIGAHKNSVTLVRAFDRYCGRPGLSKMSLVITGQDYGARRDIESAIASLDLSHRVKLVGYVPRVELPALYRCASLYVSVSFFEGFGLTPLEAMACGVPVIVSSRAALPEVVGDAGITVEPDDVEALADRMLEVSTDAELRSRLSRDGVARAKEFTWKRTAVRTLEAYKAAVDARK
jgi:glycosyltransferase involved in cell wall biosynthesis